jgi:uncharacterized protein YjbJ (UPF0337 family)
MLIEDFFEAVERAFTRDAGGSPSPRHVELKTPLELPPSVRESRPAGEQQRLPERCRLPDRRIVLTDVTHTHVKHNRTPYLATRRKTVNKDQVSGKIEQAVGKVKQKVGETVGNEKLANQGVVDQAKGAAQETWGNAKDAVKEVQQSHKDAATDKVHEKRDKLSQSVENAKEKVNKKIVEFKDRHSA